MTSAYVLARNMSVMSRHHAALRPERIHSAAVLADLGPDAERYASAFDLAAWVLESLSEPPARNPVEALRVFIEREVATRGLLGCALVTRVPRTAEKADAPVDEKVHSITDLALAIVLLSKSSDVVWVARKTPILDRETLGRRILTRDPRFFQGGAG